MPDKPLLHDASDNMYRTYTIIWKAPDQPLVARHKVDVLGPGPVLLLCTGTMYGTVGTY